jgi:hypothetical protein
MPSSTLLVARRILLALAFATPLAATVHAQQPAPAPAAAPPGEPLQNQEQTPAEGRRNQKVENLHTEDSAATVDEVRYGGRTHQRQAQVEHARLRGPPRRRGHRTPGLHGNGRQRPPRLERDEVLMTVRFFVSAAASATRR